MDILASPIKKLYFKYFAAAFGSAMIGSIYALVDSAVVGHAMGPSGTAALSIIVPVWTIIYSLGLMTGIGGSVLFGAAIGRGEKKEANAYFTVASVASLVIGFICWLVFMLFDEPLLIFFGADEALLPLAREYLLPIKIVLPAYLIVQMLSAFLRNDGNPALATASVLAGGIFNVAGDLFFVFGLDMGILGAGLATAIGSIISLLVALLHFRSPRCTLRFVRVEGFFAKLKAVIVSGFSSFIMDVAMGVIAVLFNRQIMRYSGADALAVYGVLVQVTSFVQCSAYGSGQAAQPILSANHGAGQSARVRETLRYSLLTVAAFGVIWLMLMESFPLAFIHLFMRPTEHVLAIAPTIMRVFALCYLLLPFNIFSTYYFQSVLKSGLSMTVSLTRGVILSGLFILSLPVLFGADALWLAMPLSEGVTALPALYLMRRCRLKS